MRRIGLMIMLSMMFTGVLVSLAPGQETGPSNGRPAGVDAAAVAELARAQELYNQPKTEREVISILLPLVERFEATEDWDHLVDCVFLIGDAYYHVGDWERAEKFMKIAFDLGMQFFPSGMSAYPLKVIGECRYELGKHEEALQAFKERATMLEQQDNRDELAGALFDVGAMLINTGEPAQAINFLRDALDINRQRINAMAADTEATQNDKDAADIDHAEIVYHTAIAHFRLDQLSQTQLLLDQAYKLFVKVQADGRQDVTDRLVAVLDDLVMVSESLDDTASADKFRAERDKLNQ